LVGAQAQKTNVRKTEKCRKETPQGGGKNKSHQKKKKKPSTTLIDKKTQKQQNYVRGEPFVKKGETNRSSKTKWKLPNPTHVG